MSTLTDPARELGEVCDRLSVSSGERGDNFLAKQFGVDPWSQEFYQIVFCIIERSNFVSSIVDTLELDEDYKLEAKSHIEEIKNAFSFDAILNTWGQIGQKKLSRQNIQPIKMLSPQIRQKISYPKLNDEEAQEILMLVKDLEEWLTEHQLAENDFIRQSLIDGIKQFRFRFERLSWLGWGYTIESLRDVIGAYLALEKGITDKNSNPDAAAILVKTASFLKTFYEKANLAKNVYGTGEFILKLYGAVAIVKQSPDIVGLITHLGSGLK